MRGKRQIGHDRIERQARIAPAVRRHEPLQCGAFRICLLDQTGKHARRLIQRILRCADQARIAALQPGIAQRGERAFRFTRQRVGLST